MSHVTRAIPAQRSLRRPAQLRLDPIREAGSRARSPYVVASSITMASPIMPKRNI